MQTKKLLFIFIIIFLTSQMLYGQYKEFLYGDSVRTYAVYEPELEPDPDGYPLVIGLHGANSEGYAFLATAGLVLKANAEKFIVACPNPLASKFSVIASIAKWLSIPLNSSEFTNVPSPS